MSECSAYILFQEFYGCQSHLGEFIHLIHFEFIFVYGVRKCSNFILSHVAVQLSQAHLLKRPSFLHFIFFFIEIQLIYNVVLVSSVQQRDSVIHIYIYTFFYILFHYKLLQDIQYSFLCYTVGSLHLHLDLGSNKAIK